MAASTLPVMLRGLCHDQRGFDRVAQADETVAEFGGAIERLDLVLQVTQLTNGARETVAATNESHVVPHNILDGLHVALDQRGVAVVGQPAFVPRGDVVSVGRIGNPPNARRVANPPHDILPRAIPPHQPLQQ